MASFEERVKAAATAMAPLGRESVDYWTAKADKALRAADAAQVDQPPPLRPLPPLDPHDHACPINPSASVCPTCAGGSQEAEREKAAPGPHPCEYCNHESGCGPRAEAIGARCTWPGEDHARGCAICDPCGNHEGHVSPTCRTAEDLISWKARALAAEAEDEARAQEVDQLRARIVELETEVEKLRAALERATRPHEHVGHASVALSPLCRTCEELAARRAEAMGGSDADA